MTNRRPPPPPPLTNFRPGGARPAQAPFPPRPMPPGMRTAPPMQHHRPQPQRYEAPRPRLPTSPLRIVVYLALLMVALAGAGAAWIAVNPPVDFIRERMVAAVKAKTGRDLVIAGPASLTFYPQIGVALRNVSLSPPAGMDGGPLVTMAELVVRVQTMPLLARQVAVEALVMKKPVFELRSDGKGRRNWDFAELAPPLRLAAAQTEPVSDAPSFGVADLKDIALGDVKIEGGTLNYTDEGSGATQSLTDIDVNLAMPSLDAPLQADGSVTWKGEPIDFDGTLTATRDVIARRPAKLVFSAASGHFSTTYDGSALIGDGVNLEGALSANSGSLRGLAEWFAVKLPEAPGFGPAEIKGRVKTAARSTTISGATFKVDGASGTGTISINRSGARPRVLANLTIDDLDLNKYRAPADGAAAPAAKPSPIKLQKVVPAPVPANRSSIEPGTDPIGELLTRSGGGGSGVKVTGPQVKGYTQRDGWNNEPIELAFLRVADVEAEIDADRIFYGEIKTGRAALNVALNAGRMKNELREVQLYGGAAKGVISLDASGTEPTIATNITLDGIDAREFLRAASGMNWLAGRGRLNLALTGRGASQQDIVETLGGKVEIALADGAISGFNVAGALRSISEGKLSGIKTSPSEKTDFSELTATFSLINGNAQNNDLRLISPLLRAGGEGSIDLPRREIDYLLKPKIVASLEGQGATGDASGLEIPVRISGPWAKPSYQPDLAGVMADPTKAMKTIKELGKGLKGKSVNDIADEVLGPGEGQSDRAKALLNKFFKR